MTTHKDEFTADEHEATEALCSFLADWTAKVKLDRPQRISTATLAFAKFYAEEMRHLSPLKALRLVDKTLIALGQVILLEAIADRSETDEPTPDSN